jgi:hypothetical protein
MVWKLISSDFLGNLHESQHRAIRSRATSQEEEL